MRASVRVAGPSRLPTTALPAADVYGSGLDDVALLLLLESGGGSIGLGGNAASLGGSVQGACGAITTSCRDGVPASAEAEAFMSKARRAGKVGGPAVVFTALSAAAGASATAPAANAGCSSESKFTTPGGVYRICNYSSAIASIPGWSPKSRKQDNSRRPSNICSSRRLGLMRQSLPKV